MLQIKKERLEIHLGDVEKLIKDWISQLWVPDPFSYYRDSDSWGWQSAYKPQLEQDPDSNHVLRKHLKSRALWKHHADWELRINRIWQLVPPTYDKAKGEMGETTTGERQCAYHYLGVAVWQGFNLACDQRPNMWYKLRDQGRGVAFGSYLIEASSGPEEYEQIRQGHLDLTYKLAKLHEVREVVKEWGSVAKLQEQMRALAGKALKSSDFLYSCKFCRHLWRS